MGRHVYLNVMTSTELRQREQDRERTKRSWEMAERQADEQREKERESVIRQQEEMSTRMRLQEDELMRRQQENTLFMKVGTTPITASQPPYNSHSFLIFIQS